MDPSLILMASRDLGGERGEAERGMAAAGCGRGRVRYLFFLSTLDQSDQHEPRRAAAQPTSIYNNYYRLLKTAVPCGERPLVVQLWRLGTGYDAHVA